LIAKCTLSRPGFGKATTVFPFIQAELWLAAGEAVVVEVKTDVAVADKIIGGVGDRVAVGVRVAVAVTVGVAVTDGVFVIVGVIVGVTVTVNVGVGGKT